MRTCHLSIVDSLIRTQSTHTRTVQLSCGSRLFGATPRSATMGLILCQHGTISMLGMPDYRSGMWEVWVTASREAAIRAIKKPLYTPKKTQFLSFSLSIIPLHIIREIRIVQ